MAKDGFKVIDSDMHVMEPADLWQTYISPEFRDLAPVGAEEYFMDLRLKHDGQVIARNQDNFADEGDMYVELAKRYGRFDEFLAFQDRGWGPDTQVEAMDAEGIDLALLFPSMGLFAHAKVYDDDDLAAAISRAYNNWLAEFCQGDSKRMFGAGMVPAQNIDAAVAETRRVAQDFGFKGVFLRPNPVQGRNWNHPSYDPLWAECQAFDLAVGFHEGTPCELPVAMGERFRRPPRKPLDHRAPRRPSHRADVRLPCSHHGRRHPEISNSKVCFPGRELQLVAVLDLAYGRTLRAPGVDS